MRSQSLNVSILLTHTQSFSPNGSFNHREPSYTSRVAVCQGVYCKVIFEELTWRSPGRPHGRGRCQASSPSRRWRSSQTAPVNTNTHTQIESRLLSHRNAPSRSSTTSILHLLACMHRHVYTNPPEFSSLNQMYRHGHRKPIFHTHTWEQRDPLSGLSVWGR